MTNKHFAHCILLFATLTFSPFVVSDDVYDVTKFELLGLTLGDNGEQVIQGLSEFYSIGRDDLDITHDTLGRDEPTIAYVDYVGEDFQVVTYLEPLSDSDTEEEKPYYLESFSLLWGTKPDNYKELVEQYITKYGTPTVSNGSDHIGQNWCEKLDAENKRCDKEYARMTFTVRGMSLRKGSI